jgi:hypothetical protein
MKALLRTPELKFELGQISTVQGGHSLQKDLGKVRWKKGQTTLWVSKVKLKCQDSKK